MPASFAEIINSRTFKFIVGETSDGASTEYSVHEAAIAELSTPLDSMMRGKMSEAKVGCTIWKDVSKETFERFVQFAYTGDYSIPMPIAVEKPKPIAVEKKVVIQTTLPSTSNGIYSNGIDEVSSDPLVFEQDAEPPIELEPESYVEHAVEAPNEPEEEPVPVEEAWGIWPSASISSKKVKKKKGKASKFLSWDDPPPPEPIEAREEYPAPPSPKLPTANFSDLSFSLLAPRNNHETACEVDEGFKKDHNYSRAFLAHAGLYILGDLWLIDSLKALALYKLHKTLCVYKLDNDNVDDIIDLARYAYSEEGKGFEQGMGELRGLICQYMAIHAVELASNAEFMELLGEGGEFVKDFFAFELQRVH